ncbi:hypothetical protein A6V36_30360 [Paraburkholderia ginsengiterrae]|uniref:Acetyl-CoA acetyltransferase n=1 Tax=Paraburkholderia ginsengiterrae TaxID=1462993 RepID=A0A1A9N3F0_9BURK|nr:thiolase family protein [Paraburkholderia ginsengiterrae]OAJ55991.1 hypothetical protein A6V37_32260 [Paraburkholderia ginsengiterrae]OAJ58552.1 hypothetical protein A6V36_30360 [Paraburkholderia ginsengiterrae]
MNTNNTRNAYLLDGIRTPIGKFNGALNNQTTLDLGEKTVQELLRRNPWATTPDAALLGIVVQAGLGQNPARIAALRGGAAPTTPALTLNNVCLASLEAVCDATRRIRLREGAHYLVGGFDSMSCAARIMQPGVTDLAHGVSAVMHDGLTCAFAGASMGALSDDVNKQLGIDREAQDAWAYSSQARASAASENTERDEMFTFETVEGPVSKDGCIRPGVNLHALSELRPAFSETGSITAGNASQRADGGSAGLIVDDQMLDKRGQRPLARIVDWHWVAGPDPSLHLKPSDAIRGLLEKQKLRASDIDLYEINEAFASVAIASTRALSLAHDVVNVNGGAIALGHPLGATGFRLLLTLALEMQRRHARRGIAALCGGGGQGLAVLIENVQ